MTVQHSSTGGKTAAEIQSGMGHQKWAENLILQLPVNHDGRNSWLLNYGRGAFAQTLRKDRELLFNEQSQAINPPAHPLSAAQGWQESRENIAKAIAYDLEEGAAHGARVATTSHLDNYHIDGHVNLLALADAVLCAAPPQPTLGGDKGEAVAFQRYPVRDPGDYGVDLNKHSRECFLEGFNAALRPTTAD